MTNNLFVIINNLKVPKIRNILLYEMKFLVPNYSCLQNPWLGGYRTQIPVLFVLCPQLNFWTPTRTKFLGTPLPPTVLFQIKTAFALCYSNVVVMNKIPSGFDWKFITATAQYFSNKYYKLYENVRFSTTTSAGQIIQSDYTEWLYSMIFFFYWRCGPTRARAS